MSSIALLVGAMALFLIAYVTYGAFLAKKWGIDPKKVTPAHKLEDNVDYVPTDSKVVLGHHFSSIAGAGPITCMAFASTKRLSMFFSSIWNSYRGYTWNIFN